MRVYSDTGKATTLSALGGGMGAKTGLYMIKLNTNTKKGFDIAHEREDGIRLQFPTSRTARGRVVKGKSQTLQTSGNIGVLDKAKTIRTSGMGSGIEDKHNWQDYEVNGRIRKLTPVECERLQGLPDNYTAGVSDSGRYKACGNAFNADVVAHILSFIPKE